MMTESPQTNLILYILAIVLGIFKQNSLRLYTFVGGEMAYQP